MTNNQDTIFARRQCDIWLVLDSSGFGGIESHVASLAAALQQRGFASCVVFLQDHGGQHPLAARLNEAGIPYMFAGGAFGLLNLMRRSPPRVIHSHGYKANIVSRLTARLCGIRSVSTFHAGDPGSGRTRFYTAADEASSFLSKRIAVSKAIASRLPYSCSVIENFIDLPNEPPTGTRDGVAFAGRLSHEKGADRFCRLAKTLHKKTDVTFHVFGDGPMRRQLEVQYPFIQFHGAVSDLEDRFRTLQLLVMPSRAEGLPMAALEAMATGLPVIATKVGGLPGLITHGEDGWLVENDDDPSGLESAVRGILALPRQDLESIARTARQTIEMRFSPEQVIPRILRVYGLEQRLNAYYALKVEARRA